MRVDRALPPCNHLADSFDSAHGHAARPLFDEEQESDGSSSKEGRTADLG
jgi:hypothetical protein